MKYQIKLGDWAALQPEAQAIRFDVFVKEQQVPAEIELDEMDPLCLHAIAYDADGQAVGTGRLLPDGHIGRMAVMKVARGAATRRPECGAQRANASRRILRTLRLCAPR